MVVMKVSLFKKDNRMYLQLPEDFVHDGELELFALKPGFYLLSTSLGPKAVPSSDSKPPVQEDSLLPQEIALLKKLLSVRFEKRTPVHFKTSLSNEEQNHIAQLLAKKRISIFKSQKYPDGVYNIADSVYSLMQKKALDELPPRAFADPHVPSSNILDTISTKGYAVIEPKDAYAVSEQIRKNPNDKKSITGIKSFDGKFYVVNGNFFMNVSSKIISILDKPMTIDQISQLVGAEPLGVRAVLTILAERGDVMEKRKDVFSRA